MKARDDTQPDAPLYWSLAGLGDGARAVLPVMPGLAAFAATFGAVAGQKGFSLAEALAMSAFVFAGLSQLVAVQAWPDQLTLAAAFSLAVVTATVNARFVLIGASLQPWLGRAPSWQVYPSLLLTTDFGWLTTERYRGAGGRDLSFFLGGGLVTYVVWVGATLPGYLVSAWLTDPKLVGLDLVVPAFFAAMLVPAWRGSRRAIAWAVAGLVAVAVQWIFVGWWFIVAGAIAGSITGALVDDTQ